MRRLTVRLFLITVLLSLPFLVGSAHAEPSLNEVFQHLGFTNVAKVNSVDVTFPGGMYKIVLYAEFAGYHATNEFSYYCVGEDTYNLVFAGAEGGFGYISPPLEKTRIIDHEFGLSMFVAAEGHRYYSENSLNPDGQIHSLVYENLNKPGMFLIGFENLYGAGDRDYQDMVVSIQPTMPQNVIPEVPFGTIMTAGSMIVALLGFAVSKRYRNL